MRTYVITLIVIAVIAIILGIITQLVGKVFLLGLTANAFNAFSQTMLLFAIALAVWDYTKKE